MPIIAGKIDIDLGRGYAMIIAAWFSALYPERKSVFSTVELAVPDKRSGNLAG